MEEKTKTTAAMEEPQELKEANELKEPKEMEEPTAAMEEPQELEEANTMCSWEEKQELLLMTLDGLERDGILAYIIGMGKQANKMNWLCRTVDNKIQGCISQSYFRCEVAEGNTLHIEAESEALSIQGVIGALTYMLEGEPIADMRGKEITVFHRSGFMQCLLPQRQAAVEQMLRRIEKTVIANVL